MAGMRYAGMAAPTPAATVDRLLRRAALRAGIRRRSCRHSISSRVARPLPRAPSPSVTSDQRRRRAIVGPARFDDQYANTCRTSSIVIDRGRRAADQRARPPQCGWMRERSTAHGPHGGIYAEYRAPSPRCGAARPWLRCVRKSLTTAGGGFLQVLMPEVDGQAAMHEMLVVRASVVSRGPRSCRRWLKSRSPICNGSRIT